MVLEDMIVRGLRATEEMTWLDAYSRPARPQKEKRAAKAARQANRTSLLVELHSDSTAQITLRVSD